MNGFEIEMNVLVVYTGMEEHVVIPDGVTTIGRGAFVENAHVVSVVIPDSVTVIDDHAFHGCRALESIVIPDSVTRMGGLEFSIFEDCTSLKNVTLPPYVKTLGMDMFKGCTALESITIPEGVEKLGNGIFAGCTALKDISFPSSLNSMGSDACKGTPWLAAQDTFAVQNGLLLYYRGDAKEVVVPEGVTKILPGAFPPSLKLEKLVVPEGVTSISDEIICRRGLKEIVLGASVTAIDTGWIKRKTDPNLIVKCGEKLFGAIHADTRLAMCQRWLRNELELEPWQESAIVKAVARNRDKLFMKIQGDDSIQLFRLLSCGKVKPEQIEAYIGLVNDQKHPDMMAVLLDAQQGSVKKPAAKAEAFSLEADPNDRKAWEKVYRIKEDDRGIVLAKYKGMEKQPEIPAFIGGKPVYAIGSNAFKGNATLEEIHIPGYIESIGASAFEDCVNLRSVMFAEGLKMIDKRAFFNCPSLEGEFRLPEGLTSIGFNMLGWKLVDHMPQMNHITVCHMPASLKKFTNVGADVDYYFHGADIAYGSEGVVCEGVNVYVIKGSKLADKIKRSEWAGVGACKVIEVDA